MHGDLSEQRKVQAVTLVSNEQPYAEFVSAVVDKQECGLPVDVTQPSNTSQIFS